MEEKPDSSKRRFDYPAFIEELRPLLKETVKFPAKEQTAGSASFRRWKLRLTDLIDSIERYGYDIRCGVAQRPFANMYGSGSDKVWVHHMTETQAEIELIIENYEKYGDPKPTRKARASWFGEGEAPPKASKPVAVAEPPAPTPIVPPPLTVPQQLTWGWAKNHTPVSWWWYGGGAVVALMVGAFKVGEYWESVDKALHPERPAITSSTPPLAPAAYSQGRPASK